jgi:hypothetical protein
MANRPNTNFCDTWHNGNDPNRSIYKQATPSCFDAVFIVRPANTVLLMVMANDYAVEETWA